MPYTPEHKRQTRARIVECARALFNRRGFTEVSIDEIMAAAGLTRGGFYNHFKTKDELYAETLTAFANGRQEQGCETASRCGPEVARQVFNHYVSRQHLENLDRQCPLIALPSDTARACSKRTSSRTTGYRRASRDWRSRPPASAPWSWHGRSRTRSWRTRFARLRGPSRPNPW